MIVVRVYLWPQGNPKEERLLGNIRIANVAEVEGQEGTCRYLATAGSVDALDGLPPVYVEHVRRKGFWKLVADVLSGMLVKGEQNVLDRKGRAHP